MLHSIWAIDDSLIKALFTWIWADCREIKRESVGPWASNANGGSILTSRPKEAMAEGEEKFPGSQNQPGKREQVSYSRDGVAEVSLQ